MNPDNWATILTTIFGLGLTVGHIRSRLNGLAENFKDHKNYVEKRLDTIDTKLEHIRRATNGLSHPVDDGPRRG